MKRILFSLMGCLAAQSLWAGTLTISAPASTSVGGSSPQWQYNQSGSLAGVGPTSVNGTITLSSTHTVILASATPSGITLTLPAASNTGQILQITKVDTSTQTVTIKAAGTDLLSGTTGLMTLNAISQTDEIIADGVSSWWPFGPGIQATPPLLSPLPGGLLSSVFTVATSSDIYACPIKVDVPVSVMGFRYFTATSGGNIAWGILDKNGTVIVSTGPLSIGGQAFHTVTIPPTNLSPGIYYQAFQISNVTAATDGGSVNDSIPLCPAHAETAMGIVSLTLPTGVVTGRYPFLDILVAGGPSSE